jgi:hypothetical protein
MVMASVNVKGCVYALTSVNGTIIAAVNSSVGIVQHSYTRVLTVNRPGRRL